MQLGNRKSQHSFSMIPSVNMARSKFDRSFAIKDTMNFDYLNPIFVDEVLPGDTINLNVKSFARLATQVVPLMDNMYIDYFFFFVPNRLVWDNWEKFNGAHTNPADSTDYLIPQVVAPAVTGFEVGSIYDKMGLPTGVPGISVNALPFRAHDLIYNYWFRDQNLQNSLTVATGDGPDSAVTYQIRKRAKRPDYFTSALPSPQKGAAVMLPLGTAAPIVQNQDITDKIRWNRPATTTYDMTFQQINGTNNISGSQTNSAGSTQAIRSQIAAGGLDGTMYADLSDATAATINQFRQAIMTQSLLELDARGGTRYVEILKAHFNVISPDFRLQIPEFLSSGTTYIDQHPVAQTSESASTPQATLAAFSTSANLTGKIGFSKSFVEHGYVIGFAQERADVTYQQGINRMWSRNTRWDFFWPKLQELGEQAILNKEIYAQGTANPTQDEAVFGYQERYAEYRYKPSEIRGQFRSTYAESLDVWHLAEEFESLPSLNSTFIQSSTPIERSLVVTEGYPDLLFDAYFEYKHARPIMTYGVPATLGRF